MIQVDMNALREKFYSIGQAGGSIKGDDKVLMDSLDGWQRTELLNAFNKGKQDA